MERLWCDMSNDIMELVFSKLPEPCVQRAGVVCKGWNSVANGSFKCESARSLPFKVYGVRYVLTYGRGYRILAVEDGDRVPTFSCPEDGDIPCVEAAGGLNYVLKDAKVHYKLSYLESTWRVTTDIPRPMQDPVVGVVVKSDGSACRDQKLIFAGGETYHMEDVDDLAVSIYDSVTNSWETCESLPEEFSGNTSSLCMSSVVHQGMFYVYDRNSGCVCHLDTHSRRWSAVKFASPPAQVSKLFLVSVRNGLCLVGVRDGDQRDISFNVWSVDEDSMQVGKLLHSSTVLNCRTRPLSDLLKRTSRSLEPLARFVGIFLVVLLYCMRLLNLVTVKVARRMSSNRVRRDHIGWYVSS